VGTHHFVKGSKHVLVPQPSDDKNDPLVRFLCSDLKYMSFDIKQNWSPKWKGFAIAASTMATFTQGFGPLALAPMFGDLIVSFESDLAGVVRFTGVAILVLGFSNFIW
jgi:hypothetical protein